MKKLVSKFLVIVSMFIVYFLVGCGGGSGSGSNPVSSQNSGGNVNQAFVGDWYIIYDEGRTVYPNKKSKMDFFWLKSNGDFKAIVYYLNEYTTYVETKEEIEYELIGSWSYSDGKILLSVTTGDVITLFASISNNQLFINDGISPADVYEKRDEDFNDYFFSIVNNMFVGQWNIYIEDGKPIYANNQGITDSLMLYPNGIYEITEYDSAEYDNYIQTKDGIEEKLTGNWSYNNGKLFFNDPSDGSITVILAQIENNDLKLEGNGTILLYKKQE